MASRVLKSPLALKPLQADVLPNDGLDDDTEEVLEMVGQKASFSTETTASIADDTALSEMSRDEEPQQADESLSSRLGSAPSQRFDELYNMGVRIGNGGYGVVNKAMCKRTGAAVAVKLVRIPDSKGKADITCESEHLCELHHPYVLKLHSVFVQRDCHLETSIFMVTEFCAGGDLIQFCDAWTWAQTKRDKSFDGGLPTPTCVRLMSQMLKAIAHVHSQCVVHRDIKPDNFLMVEDTMQSSLKLADFGLACRIGTSCKLSKACGTLKYAAPEMLVGESYDHKVDIWSLGVTCFEMCTGRLPFAKQNDYKAYTQNVLAGKVLRCEQQWMQHPPRLRSTVLSMLEQSPFDRRSAGEFLSTHFWLKSDAPNHNGCCVIA
mmetsp:Transcript_72159/g.207200  ORF Transcript_72159/g.207200 Transcript_72159/m.207200 type:complete len:377 (+) Transcript_72159:48-1178(+)